MVESDSTGLAAGFDEEDFVHACWFQRAGEAGYFRWKDGGTVGDSRATSGERFVETAYCYFVRYIRGKRKVYLCLKSAMTSPRVILCKPAWSDASTREETFCKAGLMRVLTGQPFFTG